MSAQPIINNVNKAEKLEMRKEWDQDGSATSYYYRKDNNGPMQVYYLSSNPSNVPSIPTIRRLSYHQPPSAPFTYYKTHGQPITTYAPAYRKIYHKYEPSVKYSKLTFKPSPIDHHHHVTQTEHHVPKHELHVHLPKAASSSSSSSSESLEDDRSVGELSKSDSSHEEDHGKKHGEEINRKKGKKSKSSYDKELKFSKGKKGSYDTKKDSGDYEKGGKKKVGISLKYF